MFCLLTIRYCMLCALVVPLIISSPSVAFGQDTQDAAQDKSDTTEATPALQYVAPKQIEMLVGVRLSPAELNMTSTLVTTVVPADWPEQKVEV